MSDDKETQELDGSLDAYKAKVSQVNKATLTWDKELIFTGRTNRGYEIEFDATQQWGCSPTESLLLSVAGCVGIDMVSFLQKMRCEIKTYKMDITGERNPTPPQYYTSIDMKISVTGSKVRRVRVSRARSRIQMRACDRRDARLVWIQTDERFDAIRDSPEYRQILRSMGLARTAAG